MIIALIVGVPLVLILMARIGDTVPALIMLGGAAFSVFVLPKVPGSPDACLAHHGDPCKGHMAALVWLVFAIPTGLAIAYKMLRGDKRGTNGGRLP